MTTITNYNYSENEISMLAVDTNDRNFLWIGFTQDDDGYCALQKVSAHDLNFKYYDIDISVTEIKAGVVSGAYLYLAYSNASLIGAKYYVENPLTTSTDFSLPAGVTEAPVDVAVQNGYVYYLVPGSSSGTNAKIVKMTTAGVFDQTIDLTTVTDASSFTIDSNDDLWVVTNTATGTYVRVYEESGGTYSYTVNT